MARPLRRLRRAETALAAVSALLAAATYFGWEWLRRGRLSYDSTVFAPSAFRLDDADEWRYTACSRLVAHGYALFTQVFSAQPPLLFLSLASGMRLVSDSIAGARVVEVAFGALGLVAAAAIAGMLAGRLAAGATALLLALSPLYLVYGRAVEAEGPMMAMTTLGLAFALAYRRNGSRFLAIASGLAIAAAILFKLFAVAALVPAVWVILSRDRRRSGMLAAGLLAATALLPVALEMALVAPAAQWDQVVTLHGIAARTALPDLVPNGQILRDFFTVDIGLTALAVAGLLSLALARRWEELGFLLLWLIGTAVMLAAFRPLFYHHTAILLTGLGVAGGVAVGRAWTSLSRRRFQSAVLVAAASVLYLAALPRLAREDRRDLVAWSRPATVEVARYVAARTTPADFIATDDLAVADLAHRLVPPALCDPSNVRLRAGYLTARTLMSQTSRYRATYVVPIAGIYPQVPAYMRWVTRYYTPVRTPSRITLYRRR